MIGIHDTVYAREYDRAIETSDNTVSYSVERYFHNLTMEAAI